MPGKNNARPTPEGCYYATSHPMLDCPDDWIEIANQTAEMIRQRESGPWPSSLLIRRAKTGDQFRSCK